MNILITGASGFIGNHLCKTLYSLGHQIAIIKRKNSNTDSLKKFIQREWVLEEINDDLNKVFETNKYDAVIHLATQFQADHQYTDISDLIDANFSFGVKLVEAMAVHKCSRLINFTTSWQNFSPADTRPVNLYAALKKAFAVTLEYYQSAHHLRVLHLRVYDTYGPNDQRRKIIPILFQAFKEGSNIDLSPGDQSIDLVHVEDICAGVVKALEHLMKDTYASGIEFALASFEPKTLKNIAHSVEKIFGKKDLLHFGGRPYRSREVMQPTYPVPQLPEWKPKIPLIEGLKTLIGNYAN